MGATFICDVHMPQQLVPLLRAKGHTADHATAMGLGRTKDIDIWRLASERDAIIITKDSDFVLLSARWPSARVVFVRLGNCANSVLLRRLDEALPSLLAVFDAGNRVVELA
jgi:predicted nuclease of predicted toxin-antitoxin system